MTHTTPVDIRECPRPSCSQAVDIFEYLTPPLIEPLMHAYHWPIGPAVRHVFTLCGKVTHPLAERPVGMLFSTSPLLPSLCLRVYNKIEPLSPPKATFLAVYYFKNGIN